MQVSLNDRQIAPLENLAGGSFASPELCPCLPFLKVLLLGPGFAASPIQVAHSPNGSCNHRSQSKTSRWYTPPPETHRQLCPSLAAVKKPLQWKYSHPNPVLASLVPFFYSFVTVPFLFSSLLSLSLTLSCLQALQGCHMLADAVCCCTAYTRSVPPPFLLLSLCFAHTHPSLTLSLSFLQSIPYPSLAFSLSAPPPSSPRTTLIKIAHRHSDLAGAERTSSEAGAGDRQTQITNQHAKISWRMKERQGEWCWVSFFLPQCTLKCFQGLCTVPMKN